jgi:hypothetical protein
VLWAESITKKFPGIPALFPAGETKFADFGQNLGKLGDEREKFAAKFPAAGNWLL